MPSCGKCGKELSSKQALQKHMMSKACIRRTDGDEKLFNEAYAVIECSLDGKIIVMEKSSQVFMNYISPGVKAFDVSGKFFYDIFREDINRLYTISRMHVELLTHPDLVMRIENVHLDQCVSKIERSYTCIMKVKQNRLFVYVNIA